MISIKNKFVSLKPETSLLDMEDGLALFRHFGRFVYVKDPCIGPSLKQVTGLLSEVALKKTISKEHKSIIDVLDKSHLLVWSNQNNKSLKNKKLNLKTNNAILVKELADFLTNIYDNQKQIEDSIKKCMDTELRIFCDSMVEKKILLELKSLPFKKIHCQSNATTKITKKSKINPRNINLVIGSWQNVRFIKLMNKYFWNLKQPWLLILIDQFGGQLGPLFSSQDGPCFECMLRRRQVLLDDPSVGDKNYFRSNFLAGSSEGFSGNSLFNMQVISATKTELIKMSVDLGSLDIKKGAILFDTYNHMSSYHEVFAVEHCSICSISYETPIRPTNLSSAEVLESINYLKNTRP